MTVIELIKALKVDDHERPINPNVPVKLAQADARPDLVILSVYEHEGVCWIDVEPEL